MLAINITGLVRAHIVLAAEVKVRARDLEGIIDAIRRINLLLGTML